MKLFLTVALMAFFASLALRLTWTHLEVTLREVGINA